MQTMFEGNYVLSSTVPASLLEHVVRSAVKLNYCKDWVRFLDSVILAERAGSAGGAGGGPSSPNPGSLFASRSVRRALLMPLHRSLPGHSITAAKSN